MSSPIKTLGLTRIINLQTATNNNNQE